jgi:hypothetical protein
MHRTITVVTLTLLLLAAAGGAEKLPQPGETSSEVPSLWAFHEVIVPLWHEAWPNKDLAQMRQLMPKIEENMAALQKAELPGILRDKKDAWKSGVSAMTSATSALKSALVGNNEKGALDAAEALHGGFERLVRMIRPAIKELDAYHVVLYEIYHSLLPAKDMAKMRPAADALAQRCTALMAAAIPGRLAAKEVEIKAAFARLCDATAALKTTAAGDDTAATAKAVETVHTAYQASAAIFE